MKRKTILRCIYDAIKSKDFEFLSLLSISDAYFGKMIQLIIYESPLSSISFKYFLSLSVSKREGKKNSFPPLRCNYTCRIL